MGAAIVLGVHESGHDGAWRAASNRGCISAAYSWEHANVAHEHTHVAHEQTHVAHEHTHVCGTLGERALGSDARGPPLYETAGHRCDPLCRLHPALQFLMICP